MQKSLTTILVSFSFFLVSFSFLSSAFASAGAIRKAGEAAVRGQYIVALKDRTEKAVPGLAKSIAAAYGGELLFVYDAVLGGFAVRLSEPAAEKLSADPRVLWVEEDSAGLIGGGLSGVQSLPSDNSLWFLDRVDQRYYNSDGSLSKTYGYGRSGVGVLAYVIDLGINASHPEFKAGQVKVGADFVETDSPKANNPCATDPAGWHGTAVASVLGGQTYGVAKDVTLVPVRVGFCNSTIEISRLLGGINWVASGNPSPVEGFASIPVNPTGTRARPS